MEFQSMKQAIAYVQGISEPSKMPGYAYGIPARACVMGSILVKIKGSVCSNCYALKGNYMFPCVQDAQARRLATITLPGWADAWVYILAHSRSKRARWMRWHDSGDLQSVAHFACIVDVATRTPNTQHWLPTREYAMIAQYLRNGGTIPANLVVRQSAHMVGRKAPESAHPQVTGSTVDGPGMQCPAPTQGNTCGDCRACWDPSVRVVTYTEH